MAFQFFAEEQVDIAVIEVGMGGRFDATNVLDPPAVLITNIAMDHENYLGHSLPAIAFEKAGIVKDGAPVVLGPVTGEPAQVIQSLATQKSATCYRFDSEFQVTHQFSNQFRYEGSYWSYEGLRCGLLGDHQVVNAACALALLEVASLQGLKVPESAVRLGLSQVVWEGRLEVMSQDPFVILDGAHNPAAADVLASSLVQLLRGLPKRRLILVVGMMQDKHHSGFLARLSPLADHVILTQSPILRSASVQMLQQALPHQGLSVQLVPDPLEALTVAREIATSSDLICITGSLILIGAVKASLLDCIPSLSQV
jgi:dihydrofolate synthase/folylpolyglutamate synthase